MKRIHRFHCDTALVSPLNEAIHARVGERARGRRGRSGSSFLCGKIWVLVPGSQCLSSKKRLLDTNVKEMVDREHTMTPATIPENYTLNRILSFKSNMKPSIIVLELRKKNQKLNLPQMKMESLQCSIKWISGVMNITVTNITNY